VEIVSSDLDESQAVLLGGSNRNRCHNRYRNRCFAVAVPSEPK
jgi:hypothetical protein